MKIVASDLAAVLSNITLGDDDNGALIVDPLPLPATKREGQVEGLFRGSRAYAKGRGNRETSFNWTVSRQHADKATAMAFVYAHEALVPVDCGLVITHAAGTTTYTSAVMVGVECVELTGLSTKFRYSVVGAIPA